MTQQPQHRPCRGCGAPIPSHHLLCHDCGAAAAERRRRTSVEDRDDVEVWRVVVTNRAVHGASRYTRFFSSRARALEITEALEVNGMECDLERFLVDEAFEGQRK